MITGKMVKDCHLWSWNEEDGICMAQLDCPVLDESKTQYESGERQCSEFSCDLQGQCEGTIVDGFISRSKAKYFPRSVFFIPFLSECLPPELSDGSTVSLVHLLL